MFECHEFERYQIDWLMFFTCELSFNEMNTANYIVIRFDFW